MKTRILVRMLVVMAAPLLAGPSPTLAQEASMLDVSNAAGYMGEWVLTMESPRGTNEQYLALTDVGGKVAAELSGGRGGTAAITDITMSGHDLVLSFERQMRGNAAPTVLTLSLDVDTLNVTQDINNGMLNMSGTGRKQ